MLGLRKGPEEGIRIVFFTPENAEILLERLKGYFAVLEVIASEQILPENAAERNIIYIKQPDPEVSQGMAKVFHSLLIQEQNQSLAEEIPNWVNYLTKGFIQGRNYLHKVNGGVSLREKTKFTWDWFKNFTVTDWQIAFNHWWFRTHVREMDQDQFFAIGNKLNQMILRIENQKLIDLVVIITNDSEFSLTNSRKQEFKKR